MRLERSIRLRSLLLTLLAAFLSASIVLIDAGRCADVVPPKDPPKDQKDPKDKKDKDDKPTGPDHNVTLAEEPGVLDLLARAQKARARAEQDPEVWPECVKYYADILRKYPNSVYLDRWEGPDKTDREYENGLYKSTRERVAADIASLPPAGLSSYRVINDPPARALFNEAQEQFDERKMEQTAQTYFSSSFGDDALVWLSEVAYDRGASRQALTQLARVAKHPNAVVSKLGLLVRTFLAQARLGDKTGATKSLEDIQAAMQGANNGTLRIGHDEGPAALEKLKSRLASIANTTVEAGSAGPVDDDGRSWETYFGNAAHNAIIKNRQAVGLLKWSWPIAQLIHGPNEEIAPSIITTTEGNQVENPTINHHLTIKDGYFYLCDANVIAAYPVGNPRPGPGSLGGNALFFWPGELDFSTPTKPAKQEGPRQQIRIQIRRNGIVTNNPVCQHPYFVTLANDRAYAVMGAEPLAQNMNIMWGGVEVKQPPNFLVAVQRRSGKRVWALESQHESPEFKSHSKADQEWLKTAYFVSAPTYESGMLYVMAIQGGAMHEAWVAAFDANTGQMQWRTQICSSNPVQFSSPAVQPDMGLPVTVANGTVYVNTNLGAISALDAAGGGIKWIRIYDRVQGNVNRFNPGGQMHMVSDFSGPNPPVLHENLLIVTPQDSDMVYAYDTETGRRVYKIPRSVRSDDGEDQLKHVLGVSNGYLIMSGSNVHFYEVKSGKIAGHFVPPTPVKGRGVVAGDVVLAATEKGLLCIDTKLVNGKAKAREEYKWEDPAKEEGGNLFVAGDVLYTVTRKYVNAYFVWQEMEAKLKDRIAKTPADLAAYCDLADVYYRIERYEQSLATLDSALQVAEKTKADEKTVQAIVNIKTRKFDAFFELGEHTQAPKQGEPNLPAAYEYYKQALAVALSPGMPAEKPVAALRCMALNASLRNDAATAIDHYQRMIAEYGDVVFAFAPPSSSKARLFSQARIDEIKKKSPGSYDKIEAQAKEALAKAGTDVQQLQALPQTYPNSEASAAALLTLAQLNLAVNPALTRQYAQRYLSRFDAASDTAAATALLAVAFERSKMLGQARDILQRLASAPNFADKTIAFDPQDPKTTQTPPLNVAAWAVKRLAEPQFQGAPSSATCSLGNGILKRAWVRMENDPIVPLPIVGIAPDQVRHNVFFVANQTDLVVLSATEAGKEVWLPRPRLPGNSLRGVWADHLLVVCGNKEIAAYDSLEKGKVVWRKNLLGSAIDRPNISVQASHGRLIVSYSGGLTVLDADTGGELWSTPVEVTQIFMPPACGDGFIAVTGQTPARVTIFELDTGARRAGLETGDGAVIPVPPVVSGDRIYVAQNYPDRKSKISAFEGRTGKLLWEYQPDGAITLLHGNNDYVFAVISNLEMIVLRTIPSVEGGFHVGLAGKVEDGPVHDLYVDGDDLYMEVGAPNTKPQVRAYSVKRGCAFRWNVDVAEDKATNLPVSEGSLATGHLVASEGNLDSAGLRPWSIVLVDRKSGKRTWDDLLESEPKFVIDPSRPPPTFSVILFDGGILISEPKFNKDPMQATVIGAKMRAYLVQDLAAGEDDTKALQDKLAKTPGDADAQVKLARRQYAAGDVEKALFGLTALMNNNKLDDGQFAIAYAGLADLRNDIARKNKHVLPFSKLDKAPKLDGTLESWAGVPEKVFESWRDVYLASEETERAAAKQSQWKGPADLKVSFRGGYDDKNLYMLFVVNDNKHNNPQTEGSLCDLGDSITLVFDIDRNGGQGFRGECFKLGACLNNNGATLAWRWVEHSLYPSKETPLESGVFVARKEAEKQTVYQFAIPLEYLTLKPEVGRKFGFSFAVHDQDDGPSVEKSIGPSPGVLGQAYPERFSEGVLQPKQ